MRKREILIQSIPSEYCELDSGARSRMSVETTITMMSEVIVRAKATPYRVGIGHTPSKYNLTKKPLRGNFVTKLFLQLS